MSLAICQQKTDDNNNNNNNSNNHQGQMNEQQGVAVTNDGGGNGDMTIYRLTLFSNNFMKNWISLILSAADYVHLLQVLIAWKNLVEIL
jgi:hypothetical protein